MEIENNLILGSMLKNMVLKKFMNVASRSCLDWAYSWHLDTNMVAC